MQLQSDGKIVVGGSAGSGGSANFAVVRFNPNGTLDTTFNGNGTSTIAVGSGDDHANAIAIQPDGKIVAAGGAFINFVWNFALVRFNANGTPDSTFGSKTAAIGSTYNEAYAVAVDASGNIVLGGRAGDSPTTDFGLVRYTSSGNLDPMFNGSGKVRTVLPFNCSGGCVGQVQSLAIQSDGKILAGGWSGQLGNADFVIVRYNSNGTIDTSFAANGVMRHTLSGGNDQILSLKIITLPDSTQRILAAGTTSPTANKANYAIARYTMNGAVDTAFGSNGVVTTAISGGNDVPASVAVDAAGNIVVGGDENDVAGDFVVARYKPNGVIDNTFGCPSAGSCVGYVLTDFGGTDQGKAVAVQPDGAILLAGVAAASTPSAKFAVARYLTTGTVGGGGPTATQLAVASVNGGSPVTAGAGFAVTVQSRDSSGAPTNVSSATQVALTLTSGSGPLSGTTNCTIAAGSNTCTASGLTLTTAQTSAVITASRVTGDNLASGASGLFAVVAASANNLQVFGFPSPVSAGTASSFTVRVRDQYNNTVTSYTGTLHFSSTDGAAVLPANYTFSANDSGQRVFTATLRTKGTWSISAADIANGAITGIQTGIIVNPGAATSLTVVSGSGQNANVGAAFAFPLVANLKDAFGNVIAGQTITFAGPASGAGASFAGGGTSINAVTDTSGNASTGTFFANAIGGAYSVAASFGGVTPASFSLTNNRASSTTSVARTSGTSPAAVNTSLTFTATVAGSAGTPTGNVNFVVDGATTFCANVALNGAGQASCTTQSLSAGTRLITAQYGGNGAYNASSSSALSQSMTKTTPAVSITATSPNPSSVNSAVTVTYTVNASPSGPLAPAGNVTVSDGSASCTGTVAAGQCAITFASSGTKTLTASYGGDVNFNAATSAGFAHTVSGSSGGATSTVALTVNPNSIMAGQTTTATATVSGSAGTPTGIVTVSGAGGSCAITLSGGTGSCALTGNTVGSNQTILGNYGGSATYNPSSGTTTLTVNQSGASATLNVVKSGSGSGTVASSPAGISCGQDCTQTFAGTTTVTLTANPANNSIFTGWLGPCTGTGQCVTTVSGTVNVSATFAPNSISPRLDVDGNGAYDALTDGLLVLRYMFGLAGAALVDDAIGTGATRTTSTQIIAYLDNIRPLLDADGNGAVDALTDGVLVVRALFGLTGAALTDEAIGPGATRTTATQISAYIRSLTP